MSARISRRQLLRGLASGTAAVALSGCGLAKGTRTPAPATPTSAHGTPSPIPSAAPSPSPTVSPVPTPLPGPSLEARIAQLLIVGLRGLSIDEAPDIARAIGDDGLGGVILFDRDQLTGGARNVASPDQLRELVAGLRERAGDRPLLVAIDQEGGRVARLSPATGFPAVDGEATIAAKGEDAVQTWATSIASTLASVGVNLNLAPVVDLDVNPRSPAIGALGRAFSADPATVARLATIEVRAHRDAGVRTALKHFPGLGSAAANTDFGVADVTATWTERELEPYRTMLAIGDIDAIMVGHVVNGQIDPDAPASLSGPTVDGLLRDDLGWDGVIVTDDLQAAAITDAFGADEAIELAIAAGNDILLLANQQTYDPGIVRHVVDHVTGLVRSGALEEARVDASYDRVVAFAG